MKLLDIVPQAEGKYTANSLPCPECGDSLTIEVTFEQVDACVNGYPIQQVLPDLSLADRERFISGYCSKDWAKVWSVFN